MELHTIKSVRAGYYSLVELAPKTEPQAAQAAQPIMPIHHIIVVDVSQSMWDDLPTLRKDMKSILTCAAPDDIATVIWFSGRGQSGVILSEQKLSNAVDFEDAQRSIDRWIQPVGMTGFVEPLSKAYEIANSSKLQSSLLFMSDGWDNQWSSSELNRLLGAISSPNPFASVTVFEYGYHADRSTLAKIATQLGGVLVFSSGYREYKSHVAQALASPVVTSSRVEWTLPEQPVGDLVFSVDSLSGTIATYAVEDKIVSLPVEVESVVGVFETSEKYDYRNPLDVSKVYAAAKLAVQRADAKVAWSLLGLIGDVAVTDEYQRCFGKQAVSKLADTLHECVFDYSKRYADGYKALTVPREDLLTIVDFFYLLGEGDRVKLNFTYNRIGRKAEELDPASLVDRAAERLVNDPTEENRTQLVNAVGRMGLNVAFEVDDVTSYTIDGLVFAQGRANLSFRIKQDGFVVLSGVPEQHKAILPNKMRSYRYRNFSVVRDGLVNIDKLEMWFSNQTADTISKLVSEGRLHQDAIIKLSNGYYAVDFTLIPITNMMYAQPVDPKYYFELEFAQLKAKASLKVFKHFLSMYESSSAAPTPYAMMYGPTAEWLKSVGITERGFNPLTRRVESTDVYQAREISTLIRGYSALPSVNELIKQIDKGKIGTPARLMHPSYQVGIEAIKSGDLEDLLNLFSDLVKQYKAEDATLTRLLCNINFGMIVGNVWFAGASADTEVFEVELDGEIKTCNAVQKMIEVPI